MEYKYIMSGKPGTHRMSIKVPYGDVIIRLYTSNESFATLYIIKISENEDINIVDYFMDFLELLYKIQYKYNISDLSPRKISDIEFSNMTINNDDLRVILYLCEIAKGSRNQNKKYSFRNCRILKGTALGVLPCKNEHIYIDESIIEDFSSFNGIDVDGINIKESSIQNYTGIVNLHCRKIILNDVEMDYQLFFVKTQAPETESLVIYCKHFVDKDLLFLPNFYNLKYLELSASLEDTSRIDMLKNLGRSFGTFIRDRKNNRWIPYFGIPETLRYYGLYPPSYEEHKYWRNRIENETRETVIEDMTWEIRQGMMVGAILQCQNIGNLPDISFLFDNECIKKDTTRRYEFNLETEDLEVIPGIEFYRAGGIYIPNKKVVHPDESPFKSLTRREDYMTLLEYKDGKIIMTTIDKAGNFIIKGSLTSDNIDDIRKQLIAIAWNSLSYDTISVDKRLDAFQKKLNRELF